MEEEANDKGRLTEHRDGYKEPVKDNEEKELLWRGEDYQEEDTPNLPRRERIATAGEADLINKTPLRRIPNFGSIPNLDREDGSSEGLDHSGSSSSGVRERYFRPRAFRRTTISLSKREVRTLGLTVAKRVDESILDDIRVQREQEEEQRRSGKQDRGTKSEEKAINGDSTGPRQLLELQACNTSENAQVLDRVGNQLHNTLTKQFDRIRSASMSDILDCDTESIPDVDTTPDPSNSDRESDVFSPQHHQRLELGPTDSNSRVTKHVS